MTNDHPYEVDCQYDVTNDTILIRVRRMQRNKDGVFVKKGIGIRITEELFKQVAEGQDYPIAGRESVPADRYSKLADEIE